MKKQQIKIDDESTNEELELYFNIEISKLYIKQKELLEYILYTNKKLDEFKCMLCSDDILKEYNEFNLLSEFYCENMELYLLHKKEIQDLKKDLKDLKE